MSAFIYPERGRRVGAIGTSTVAGGSVELAAAMRRRLALAVLLVVLGTTTALPSLTSPLMTFDDGAIELIFARTNPALILFRADGDATHAVFFEILTSHS